MYTKNNTLWIKQTFTLTSGLFWCIPYSLIIYKNIIKLSCLIISNKHICLLFLFNIPKTFSSFYILIFWIIFEYSHIFAICILLSELSKFYHFILSLININQNGQKYTLSGFIVLLSSNAIPTHSSFKLLVKFIQHDVWQERWQISPSSVEVL